MTLCFQPRRGLAPLAAVMLLALAAPVYAQSAAVMYERALGRERAARAERDPAVTSLRAIAQSYESLVRKYPASGYADNSLWQAAGVMELAYARSGAADDRARAERYLTWLRREYPRSSLVKDVPSRLAALTKAAPAVTSGPATPPPATSKPGSSAVTNTSTQTGTPAVIRSVTHSALPRGDRIVIELSKEVDYLGNRVDGPDRVFFDFSHAIAASSLSERASKINAGLVSGLRFGRHANGTTRVVLELTGSPRYSSYPLYNPFRVIIDVESSGPPPPPAGDAPPVAAAKPNATTPPQVSAQPSNGTATADNERPVRETPKPVPPSIPVNSTAPPVSSPPPATPPPPSPAPAATTAKGDYSLARQLGLGVSRIVIDPGHGGHDPGARANGLNEADLVLDIAQRVATLLREQRGVEVVLTRDKNVFIPLEERTAIANRAGPADLFVSIHANASRSHGARGSEVYFLSHEASDEETRRLALAEGGLGASAGLEAGSSSVALILWDMAQAEHLEESSALATRLHEELAGATNSQARGVKQAPFRVLVGAAMPAVLVEVGFISNAEEERLLTSDEYQQKVVAALVRGLSRYQQQREHRRGTFSSAGAPSGQRP